MRALVISERAEADLREIWGYSFKEWGEEQDTRIWYPDRRQHREAPMPKNTSFILGEHFDAFVAGQIDAGRYANATDVIRSGLRLLEE